MTFLISENMNQNIMSFIALLQHETTSKVIVKQKNIWKMSDEAILNEEAKPKVQSW